MKNNNEKPVCLATRKQIEFLEKFCDEYGIECDLENITKKEASEIIDYFCHGGEKPESVDKYLIDFDEEGFFEAIESAEYEYNAKSKATCIVGIKMDEEQFAPAYDFADGHCNTRYSGSFCGGYCGYSDIDDVHCKIYCTDEKCLKKYLDILPTEKQIDVIVDFCNDKKLGYSLYNLTRKNAEEIIEYMKTGKNKPECYEDHIEDK